VTQLYLKFGILLPTRFIIREVYHRTYIGCRIIPRSRVYNSLSLEQVQLFSGGWGCGSLKYTFILSIQPYPFDSPWGSLPGVGEQICPQNVRPEVSLYYTEHRDWSIDHSRTVCFLLYVNQYFHCRHPTWLTSAGLKAFTCLSMSFSDSSSLVHMFECIHTSCISCYAEGDYRHMKWSKNCLTSKMTRCFICKVNRFELFLLPMFYDF
jgi:hypothetical protein